MIKVALSMIVYDLRSEHLNLAMEWTTSSRSLGRNHGLRYRTGNDMTGGW